MNTCAGRNESGRSSSLKVGETRWLSIWIPCEGSTFVRKVTEAPKMRRWWNRRHLHKDLVCNWRDLPHAVRNCHQQGGHYNRTQGKCTEDERESDGIIIAKRSGNADGAK